MTSLEKAKSFLKKAALNIVPLAFVAMSAHAATFIPASTSCPGASGGTLSSLALPDSNGVVGVKFFTTFDCTAAGTGDGVNFDISASGGFGGAFPIDLVSIPVHISFTAVDDTAFTLQFSLFLQINGLPAQGITDFQFQSGELVDTGFDYLIDTPGMDLNTWVLTLTMMSTSDGPDSMSVNIPQNSLDINLPGPVADTPEPSSLLMLAGGGAFLAFLRRRNNHQ